MNTRQCSHRRSAFSLVEILVALGLFAMAISGLLALFPVALRTEKESEEETRATLIASGVMEALNSSEGKGVLSIASGMSNNLPTWESIAPSTMTNISVSYSLSCEPIRKLSIKEAAVALSDSGAAAILTLTLTSKPSLPGLLTAEVLVASPASAPVAGRTVRRFVRLITTPSP